MSASTSIQVRRHEPDLLIGADDEASKESGTKSKSGSLEDSKAEKSEQGGATVRSSKKVVKMKMKKITNWTGCNGAQLDDEPFYHGYMCREESEKLLKSHGEFLVRKTELTKRGEVIVLSVYWNDECYHLVIEKFKGLVYLKDFCFDNISDLIRYHHKNRVEVYRTGIKLFTWVVREEWQLYHEQITLSKKLGNGEFGEVFKGQLSLGIFTADVEVAVKTMKGSKVTADEKITFLREANLMLKLNHKYVVRLYGVATQKEPIMIVMEICPGGSLKERLSDKEKPLTLKIMRRYSQQIAKGMRYLEKKQVIHRDLAARNCLLDDHDNCKISDFGLSLLGKQHKEHKLMKVPVRWMPPETLQRGVYSSKSDVWSFGVTMWEIYSHGEYPYGDVKVLKEVRRQVCHEHLRLQAPEGMPAEDEALMKMCFEDVKTRKCFAEICAQFKAGSMESGLTRFVHKLGFGRAAD